MAGVELMTGEELVISNVLAERYASSAMCRIWSREEKIRRERRLWIEVMKAQSALGLDLSIEQIARYEECVDHIDLNSIDERERVLKHDVKARIEEFNDLAGLQLIHFGLTSRDITENVELLQIRDALVLIRSEVLGILILLAKRMDQHKTLVVVGRTHNIPAQLTTLGKRFATIAEELLFALGALDSLIDRLPMRGLRGPVGTTQDLFDLVGSQAEELESQVAKSLEFSRTLDSTGQIYPRSIDFQVVSTLVQVSAALSNLAIMVRLMSGAGLLSEGFTEGQVGSSAMPHKVNPRLSERINGLAVVLKGYLSMISEVSGDLWNEGDVSCSVVRRVALQDAFLAIDGMLQTAAAVLQELHVSSEAITREVEEHLPLMATSRILAAAMKIGMSREDAYRKIQQASLTSLKSKEGSKEIDYFDLLAEDPDFPLNKPDLDKELSSLKNLPMAIQQVDRVLEKIAKVSKTKEVSSFNFQKII